MRLLARVGVTLLAITLTSSWLMGLRFNLTGSMPVGLYRTTPAPVQRNAIVLVCLPPPWAEFARARSYVPNGPCDGGDAPLGKRVVAVWGDTVVKARRGLTVNGSFIANSEPLASDSRGRALPQLPDGPYAVRYRELWVVSSHSSRSFDSRYFGPVADSRIIRVIQPLLTK